MKRNPFVSANVVPTGLKAEIGGFVGDAVPAANVLASVSDLMLVNPNVVNGVMLNQGRENVFSVEGYSLDSFFKGELALRFVESNKIGVVLDKASERDSSIALNTVNALRANQGVEVVKIVSTSKPVEDKIVLNPSGAIVGELKNPWVIIEAVQELIASGAEAIALATHIDIEPKCVDSYLKGKIPNPMGGLEAVISHLVSKYFMLPCEHAPMFYLGEAKKMLEKGLVDSRAASEFVCSAYLGSVLKGLSNAPRPVPIEEARQGDMTVEDIDVLVYPAGCLGGVPVLAALKKGIPVIAVEENKTVLSVDAKSLNSSKIIPARNYFEAAGIMAALREGISIESVRRPLRDLDLFNKELK